MTRVLDAGRAVRGKAACENNCLRGVGLIPPLSLLSFPLSHFLSQAVPPPEPSTSPSVLTKVTPSVSHQQTAEL